MNDYKSEYNLQ